MRGFGDKRRGPVPFARATRIANSLFLLLVFGAEMGPLAAIRDCPLHGGGHTTETVQADGRAGLEAEHSHAVQATVAAEGRNQESHLSSGANVRSSHSGEHDAPCDCMECVTGTVLPVSKTAALVSVDLLDHSAQAGTALDSLAADHLAFLAPDANPPPA